MIRALTVPALFAAALVPPQSAAPPGVLDVEPWRADVEAILAGAMSQGKAYERLVELCATAPHRLAGSEGAARAVAWARDEMLRAGLENVRLEPCRVPRWERGDLEECQVLVGGAEERPPAVMDLSILALGGSVATPEEGISAEVVEVQSFEELRGLGEGARGRIVFFNRPMDPRAVDSFAAYGGAVSQRSAGAIEAAKAGGVAALVRSMSTRLDDFPHTGAMRYEEGVERVPAAAVSTLGAERLSALLASGVPVRVRLRLGCRTLEDVDSHNVVGELVGRERPDEILVVGGHLDCWDVGQGAHDDGGGVCQAIEAASLLGRLGLRPRRTIRVVAFMNEENGVRGGHAYYAAHLDEMERHVLAVESDRGVFTPRGFTTDANPRALAILQQIATLLAPARADVMEPGYGGVDISPMQASGVVTAGFLPDCQRYFDLHHSARDTIEQVSRREIDLGAGVIAALLYVVADLPEPLPRNPIRGEGR